MAQKAGGWAIRLLTGADKASLYRSPLGCGGMTAQPPPAHGDRAPPATPVTVAASFQDAFCWRRWRNLLQSPTAALLGAGLLLPNLLSLATLTSFIDVGLAPRTSCIILYATLAVRARRLPFAVTALLVVALLGFDVIWTLSLMFGLAPTELLVALNHASRVNLLASPLYVSLIGVMMLTSARTLYLLSRRARLLQGNIYLLLGAALLFAALDFVTNVSPHYQYGSMYGRKVPVVSATDVSGFNKVAGTNGRNTVLVTVESLGYMIKSKLRARIADPLSDSHIAQKYVVTSGSATYYGSTTAGEMRELCTTLAFYADYTSRAAVAPVRASS